MHRKLAAAVCVFSLTFALLAYAVVTTVASNAESSLVFLTADWMRVEPSAKVWPLVVTLFSTEPVQDVKLQIKVEDRNITAAVRLCPDALPVNLIKGISTAALRRFVSVARHQLVEDIPAGDLREFGRLSSVVMSQSRELKSLLLEIPTDRLPIQPENGGMYDVMLWADSSVGADAVETKVLVSSLPKDTVWLPAELHVHSRVSDNCCYTIEQVARIYRNLGYRALYMTDHLEGVENYGWEDYSADVAAAGRTQGTCVLPGVEISTAYEEPDVDSDDSDDNEPDDDNNDQAIFSGDLLAYGVRNLAGLTDTQISPERAIQAVQDNNPQQSSSAIAHPCRPGYGWGNWTLSGYSGIEIMSGWQFEFGPDSRPFKRWVADVNRQLPDAFSSGCFPGVRVGGDWHGLLNPRSYVTWIGAGEVADAMAINQALNKGRTVASRFGGLATFVLGTADQSYGIGEIIQGVSSGTKLKADVRMSTVLPGEYKLAIYESSKAEPVLEWNVRAGTGEVVADEGALVFPGGQQCYYLVVTGVDFICTSPIFVGR